MKTIDKPKYQHIEYPIKEMVRFVDMEDGRWRIYYKCTNISFGRKMTRKMWKELDYQINKFIEEDGRFAITYQSYFPEYYLPMVVFPKTRGV